MSVDVDERAAYALLRYGAIPAPLTLYTQVQRIPNGHLFRLPPAGEPECTPMFQLTDLRDRNGGMPQPDTRGSDTLDAALARVPGATGLYFSGGGGRPLPGARPPPPGRHDPRPG